MEGKSVKEANAFLFILVYVGISVVLLPPVSYGRAVESSSSADVREAGSHRDPEVLNMSGTKVSFRSFLGRKPLLVVFWATWCPLCRDEVPTLNRFASDPAIQVLAVNLGENEQKVQSFISSFHVGYPVVRDPGWQTTADYQVVGIPACIMLDEGGQILYRGSVVPGNIDAYVRR